MNIALVLSYLGTGYHGWQRQKNALSIQEVLEEALGGLLHCPPPYVSGCGRTDAKVHASKYVASFHADCPIPLPKLPLALNAVLPPDIAVLKAVLVPEAFDARFSCKSKEYTYRILNRPVRDPFFMDRAYFHPAPLETSAMAEAAKHFVGKKDFKALKNEGTELKSTVREIFSCAVSAAAGLVEISVCADGFMYNMVRNIAGTLIYVGAGKMTPNDVALVINSKQRVMAGPTVPGHGLYLSKLTYGVPELDA